MWLFCKCKIISRHKENTFIFIKFLLIFVRGYDTFVQNNNNILAYCIYSYYSSKTQKILTKPLNLFTLNINTTSSQVDDISLSGSFILRWNLTSTYLENTLLTSYLFSPLRLTQFLSIHHRVFPFYFFSIRPRHCIMEEQ